MWNNLGRFLEKFANLKPSKKLIEEEGAKIISALLGVEIKREDIEERNGILFFKSLNQVLKNEIFLKKEEILSALKKHIGARAPRDIRF